MTFHTRLRLPMLLAALLAIGLLALPSLLPPPAANAQDMTEVDVWSATMTVGDQSGNVQGYASGLIGTLSGEFTHQSTGYTVSSVLVNSFGLNLGISPFPGTDRIATWTLKVDGTEYALADATVVNDSDSNPIGFRWTSNAPSWSSADSVALSIVAKDTDATGAATVTGTAEVGQALTANVSGFTDANGVPTDAQDFSYQWVRAAGGTDTDITGATAPSYYPTPEDVGKTMKVKVGFEDLDGFSEGPFTGAATAAVQASDFVTVVWSATLTVGQNPNITTFKGYDASHPYGALNPTPAFTVDDVTYSFALLNSRADLNIGLDPGLPGSFTILYGGMSELDSGDATETDLTGTSAGYFLYTWANHATGWGNGDRVAVALTLANSAATGAPTVDGTARVGDALTANVSGITDSNGVPTGAQDFTYQWLRVESGADTVITGATAPSYYPSGSDVGKTVKVRVGFKDNSGFTEGPLTSAASAAVQARATRSAVWSATLTVGVDSNEIGYASGTFSSDGGTYGSLSGYGFTAYGDPYLVDWLAFNRSTDDLGLYLTPGLPRSFTLHYGGTGELHSGDATEGDFNLPNIWYSWSSTNPGWAEGDRVAVALTAAKNVAATGAPRIEGLATLGQTLTAGLSGITDPNGVPDTASYQWLRHDQGTDTVIAGATGAAYTLTSQDVGKTIKVRVSFTDNDGFSEGPLTSEATADAMERPATVQYQYARLGDQTTLVSNTGQAPLSGTTADVSFGATSRYSQPFTTGTNMRGYGLDSIRTRVSRLVMKWVRHRCQLAPPKTAAMAPRSP